MGWTRGAKEWEGRRWTRGGQTARGTASPVSHPAGPELASLRPLRCVRTVSWPAPTRRQKSQAPGRTGPLPPAGRTPSARPPRWAARPQGSGRPNAVRARGPEAPPPQGGLSAATVSPLQLFLPRFRLSRDPSARERRLSHRHAAQRLPRSAVLPGHFPDEGMRAMERVVRLGGPGPF